LDFELEGTIPLEDLAIRLREQVPVGLEAYRVGVMPVEGSSLAAAINRADYVMEGPGKPTLNPGMIDGVLQGVLGCPQLLVERRGKKGLRQVDIRPGIFRLEGRVVSGQIRLQSTLLLGPEGHVRPLEVCLVVNRFCPEVGGPWEIERTGLWMARGDCLTSPMEELQEVEEISHV
jgi:hypothetical protein